MFKLMGKTIIILDAKQFCLTLLKSIDMHFYGDMKNYNQYFLLENANLITLQAAWHFQSPNSNLKRRQQLLIFFLQKKSLPISSDNLCNP